MLYRDTYMRRGETSTKILAPGFPITVVERIAKMPISMAKAEADKINCNVVVNSLQADVSRIMQGNVNAGEIEKIWISSFWKRCRKSKNNEVTIHKLDFRSSCKSHQYEQAYYLTALGFYKRLLYTRPVSDRDQYGKATFAEPLTESIVIAALSKKNVNLKFGTKDGVVPIEDNWVAKGGKVLGALYHRVTGRDKKELDIIVEGTLVIVAIYHTMGENAMKSVVTLMRAAEVFKTYKALRIDIENTIIEQGGKGIDREPLEAATIYGLYNDIQQGEIRHFQCSNCELPFYTLRNTISCPNCGECNDGKNNKFKIL